jgi:hypothetical protein
MADFNGYTENAPSEISLGPYADGRAERTIEEATQP